MADCSGSEGQDIAADWQGVGPDVSAGNPLPSFNSRAYVYAGLDQPVLRGYFDGTDGSTSPDGGYQVYAPDGLGSVMGVLGQQRSIDLVQQSENTLSSQGGFNAGSYANPKAWGAPADGSVRDPSYFSGDGEVIAPNCVAGLDSRRNSFDFFSSTMRIRTIN